MEYSTSYTNINGIWQQILIVQSNIAIADSVTTLTDMQEAFENTYYLGARVRLVDNADGSMTYWYILKSTVTSERAVAHLRQQLAEVASITNALLLDQLIAEGAVIT